MRKNFLILMYALAGALASTATSAASPPFTLETVRNDMAHRTGTAVVVQNRYGDIRVRPGNESEKVWTLSAIQHIGEHRNSLQLDSVECPLGTCLTVIRGQVGDRAAGRLDLTVVVPRGSDLRLQTLKGLIEVKGLRSQIHANSVEGNIKVKTPAALFAQTGGTGQISSFVDLETTEFRAQTASGQIVLNVIGARWPLINVWTAGSIVLPKEIEAFQRADPGQTLRLVGQWDGDASAGKQAQVDVFSASGDIRFVHIPAALPPGPPMQRPTLSRPVSVMPTAQTWQAGEPVREIPKLRPDRVKPVGSPANSVEINEDPLLKRQRAFEGEERTRSNETFSE